MRPSDVANDDSLLLRFRDEVAYCDRPLPSEEEMRDDTELLRSDEGVLVVAWLWPGLDYASPHAPFARARERADAAKLFRLLMDAAASAAGQMIRIEHLEAHLMWSVPLTRLELERLSRGDAPFPFRVIAGICRSLQLTFTHDWVLKDPQRLARRIEQSVAASAISGTLRNLTLDSLKILARKLPKGALTSLADTDPADTCLPPEPGGRYRPLYEALAADDRESPTYSVGDINRMLAASSADGNRHLPESATDRRRGRSWWAGSARKTEARPQVRAWWAAGYRVGKADLDSDSPDEQVVTFEALPIRREWLSDPRRAAWSEHRAADPETVLLDLNRGARHEDIASRITPEQFEALKAVLGSLVEPIQQLTRRYEADDPDIRDLTNFLHSVGEADRGQIDRHFNVEREAPVDMAWMTNLLTRARRQGWIINLGTRRQPRWAATQKRALMIDQIAERLNLENPSVDAAKPVPAKFFRRVAEKLDVVPAGNSPIEIAQEIVAALGGEWKASFASADGSVTSLGLQVIHDSLPTV